MSWNDNIQDSAQTHTKVELSNPFINFFLENERLGEDSAFTFSMDSFSKLKDGARTLETLQELLLEDIIFSSLNATYYETLFITIKKHPDLFIPLIDKFSESSDVRSNEIAGQAEEHFQFVLKGGSCSGCKSCENHKDVYELVTHWNAKDVDFFITLYLGMQTIQYTLEQILYDLIPTRRDLIEELDSNIILEFRKYVYSYTEKKLDNL